MASLLIKNANVFCDDKIFRKGNIFVADGKIKKVLCGDLPADEVYDACGNMAVPGFIDIHIHGRFGINSEKNPQKLADKLKSTGVTAYLPTLMTGDFNETVKTLKFIKEQKETQKSGAEILGAYSEGIFLSLEKCGAQNPKYIKTNINLSSIKKMADVGILKVLALAPENKGAVNAAKYLVSKGINVTLAHTNASYEKAKAVTDAGAKGSTHTFNAMTKFAHTSPGVLGEVLTNDNVYCEIICDGFHVSKAAVNLLFKAKPKDKVILITDNLNFAGCKKGDYVSGGLPVINMGNRFVLKESPATLAGSTVTLVTALKNAVDFTSRSLAEVLPCVCENPAKYLGVFDRKGSISENKDADINIMTDNYKILKTFTKGR